MDNIKHLIEVLKSQISLYSELHKLMLAEKESVIAWAINETVEINKKKELLLRKERVQEEARSTILGKLAQDQNKPTIYLSDVVAITKSPEQKATLIDLGSQLKEIVSIIQAENLSLRMMYTTNNRLISDFFTSVGMSNTAYDNTGNNKKLTSTRTLIG